MPRTLRSSTLFAALAAVLAVLLPPASAAGDTAQHAAGLVIDTGERVVTAYVEFPEETITGEELLRRADVDAVFSDYGSMGTAVCSILGVGSPQDDCFREAEENGLYWNYSRAEDGAWQRSSRGVSSTTVEHGDVDGWAWGQQGSQPPYHSFEEIRAQHAPEPSPSPTPAPAEEPAPEPEPDTGPPQGEQVHETAPTDPAVGSPSSTETATETATKTASETATETSSSTTSTTATPEVASGSTPDDRASPSATPAAAADDGPDAGRGLWSLVTFLAVMAGLVATIVWRRRDRSGITGRAPQP